MYMTTVEYSRHLDQRSGYQTEHATYEDELKNILLYILYYTSALLRKDDTY